MNSKQVFRYERERATNLTEGMANLLRFAWWWFRKTFFIRIDSQQKPALIVHRQKPEIESVLGKFHFEPGWELSFYYKGEIINLRRAEFFEDTPHKNLKWWQIHLRGYENGNGEIALTPHFEPDPSEHPDAHICQRYISRDHALDVIKEIFDSEEIEFREEKEWTLSAQ
jgi:hypothetical protein